MPTIVRHDTSKAAAGCTLSKCYRRKQNLFHNCLSENFSLYFGRL
jgi:hypothetical protein